MKPDRLDLLVLYTFSLVSGLFLISTFGPVPANAATFSDWAAMVIGAFLILLAVIVAYYLTREVPR